MRNISGYETGRSFVLWKEVQGVSERVNKQVVYAYLGDKMKKNDSRSDVQQEMESKMG